MINISAIIIAKNNEEQIAGALDSVAFCDEIIVVDGGSTDNTIEIAKKHKARIITGHTSDFAKQREAGMKAAKGEWLLYIDTDERVSKALKENIIKTVLEGRKDVLKIKRQNYFLGNNKWPKIEKLERLFKKSVLKGWFGALHETPKFEGKTDILDGYLLHYTHRNLTEMLEKTIVWSQIEAKLRFDSGHPKMAWWRFPRVMMTAFGDSYFKQGGWKVGTVGLIESTYQSFSMFVTYARLWEMQQEK